jgi:hypothetical protein
MSDTKHNVAWVEIHGAVLHCTCGHKTDFTDSVRQVFCSRAVAQCARCKLVWETPAAADCEPQRIPNPAKDCKETD